MPFGIRRLADGHLQLPQMSSPKVGRSEDGWLVLGMAFRDHDAQRKVL